MQTGEVSGYNREAANSVPGRRASDHLLRGIIESLADGVVTIDEKGLIQSFSPAAAGIFGYAAQEVIGRNVNMLMAEPEASQHDGYLRRYFETGESRILGVGPREVTGRRKDGTVVPLELAIGEMRREEGRLFIGTLRDVSERKALERDAAEKSALLNTTFDTIAQGYAVYDRDLRLIRYNAQFEKLFGFPPGFLHQGISQEDIVRFRAQRGDYGAGDIDEIVKNRFEDAKTPSERSRERTLTTGTVYVHHRKSLPDGGCVTTYTDITDLKTAEREAAKTSALLKSTFDTVANGLAVFDADHRLIDYNRQYEKLFGFTPGFLRVGLTLDEISRDRAARGQFGDRGVELEKLLRTRAHAASMENAAERMLPDGTTYVYQRKIMPDGGFVTSYTDITSLKQAQREADTKTALLETTMEAMAQGYAVYDPESRLVAFNRHFENLFGFPQGFLVPNRALEDIIRYRVEHDRYEQDDISHDGLEDEVARRAKNFADRRQETGERTLLDGKTYVYNRRPMPNGGVVSTYTDITDIKETETALRESQAKFRGAFENAGVGVFIRSADGKSREFNDTFCEMLGYSEAEMQSMHLRDISHPDDDPQATSVRHISFDSEISYTVERRLIRKDGKVIWCYISYRKVYDADGKLLSTIAMCQDITERKEAEHRLQQAQKMEAVGQLTGGVAHDFNNLLAVIMGNVELLAEGSDNPESLLESISRSATRGAELTQRLLAFSRLQPLHPQPIDLSDLIDGMMGLLRRSLGETIEICSDVASNLWQAQADPGQVENALLNLALNARDAMPNGGRLTIACANAHLGEEDLGENFEITAGEYIMLTVEDTGTGMPAEVLEHVFEPFYTTKEVGQGSGLGLSMVYGFARQSGGHVAINSEEGRGTNVKLYLPRAESELAAQAAEQGEDIPTGGGETVLVLEDDADVRSLVETMIGGLGYQVVTAPTAADAQAALERENIDVVLSDVVLPDGVNGPAFAQQARTLHPDLTVIFMSGYPADGVAANGGIGPDEVLLNKPFKRQILATALHRALSGM